MMTASSDVWSSFGKSSYRVNHAVGIYTIIAWLLDVSIMFPFVEVEPDEIPMGRMHAIRLAVIGTFAFYGLMHLLQGSAEVFPIHFLKTFLFFCRYSDLPLLEKPDGWNRGVLGTLGPRLFWLGVALVLTSRPRRDTAAIFERNDTLELSAGAKAGQPAISGAPAVMLPTSSPAQLFSLGIASEDTSAGRS